LNSPEFVEVIRKTSPDYVISGYYARIFKKAILTLPPKGCINIHPTGLPRFRGLSPYFTHLLHGDDRQYITMHWLDPGVDTGDIIAQASVEVRPDDTGFTVGTGSPRQAPPCSARIGRRSKPYRPAHQAGCLHCLQFQLLLGYGGDRLEEECHTGLDLVRAITRPFSGAWTMVGGYKMHVWKVRVVAPEEELKVKGALPGEVLAADRQGILGAVREGQVQILEASLDDLSDSTPFELVASTGGQMRLLLG